MQLLTKHAERFRYHDCTIFWRVFKQTQASSQRGPTFIKVATELDNQLHDLIAESCSNRFLGKEIARLRLLFRALRDAAWQQGVVGDDHYRFSEETKEHRAIVEALIDGDPQEASAAMAEHINAGMKYWSRAFPD